MRTRNHESGRIKRELPHLPFLKAFDEGTSLPGEDVGGTLNPKL
jgi:hypothetical protein